MSAQNLTLLLMLCAGLVLLAWIALAGDKLWGWRRKHVAEQRLDAVLAGPAGAAADAAPRASTVKQLTNSFAKLGEQVSASRFGQMSLEDEDVRLLALCGFRDVRSRYIFLASRLLLPLLVALGVVLFWQGGKTYFWLALFGGAMVGFLAPKWVLNSIGARRRARIDVELPWLLELLQLLLGVGLSIDQAIQMVISDFRVTAPVLAEELELANRLFVAGRTRTQSLQRLVHLYQNDDLKTFVDLLQQIDKYGGSVQEPIKRFSDRLVEQRRTSIRAKIGELSVKMTGVMVLFMFPSLLLIAGGPGILAVMRALGSLAKGG